MITAGVLVMITARLLVMGNASMHLLLPEVIILP